MVGARAQFFRLEMNTIAVACAVVPMAISSGNLAKHTLVNHLILLKIPLLKPVSTAVFPVDCVNAEEIDRMLLRIMIHRVDVLGVKRLEENLKNLTWCEPAQLRIKLPLRQ